MGPPGFEPGITDLQSTALPLGYTALLRLLSFKPTYVGVFRTYLGSQVYFSSRFEGQALFSNEVH